MSPRSPPACVVGVKAPIECWPIAVDRVRYVGEPVAVVVAADRYLAEDALDLIEVDYEPLPVSCRSARCAEARRAVLHEGFGRQHRERPLVPLRRSGARLRAARASRLGRRPLSAQLLHADRNLRRRRRIRSGRGRLRRAREFPGAVQHPCGDGARAESAGQPAAPAHAARFRRQLRREAGRLSLHRADGASPRASPAAR